MARAVTNSRRSEPVLGSFVTLAATTFKVLATQEPSCLSELFRFHTLHTTFDLAYSKIRSNLRSLKERFVTQQHAVCMEQFTTIHHF